MQKIEYFTFVYHSFLFFCSKRCQIKFNKLLDQKKLTTKENYKILQLKILKDFVKIYRECTKEPYSFLRNDTTLTESDPLGFRKKLQKLIRLSF